LEKTPDARNLHTHGWAAEAFNLHDALVMKSEFSIIAPQEARAGS
jgi:hypothetical protein